MTIVNRSFSNPYPRARLRRDRSLHTSHDDRPRVQSTRGAQSAGGGWRGRRHRWQQAHDVRTLFVMDGAGFGSTACQNPTITILALAARACDYLVDEYRAGRV